MFEPKAQSQLQAASADERLCMIVQWKEGGPELPEDGPRSPERRQAWAAGVMLAKAPLLTNLKACGLEVTAPLEFFMMAVLEGTVASWKQAAHFLEDGSTLVLANTSVTVSG